MKPEDIQFEATVVVSRPHGDAAENTIRVTTNPPVGKEWIEDLVRRLDEVRKTLARGAYKVRIGAFTLIHCVDNETHDARTICKLLAVPMTGLLASLQRVYEDDVMTDASLVEMSAENLTTRIFDGHMDDGFDPGRIRTCVASGKVDISSHRLAVCVALEQRNLLEVGNGDSLKSKRIGKRIARLQRKQDRKQQWDVPDVDEYSLLMEVDDSEPAFTDWQVEYLTVALMRLTPAIERRVAELLRETHLAAIEESKALIVRLESAFGVEVEKGV